MRSGVANVKDVNDCPYDLLGNIHSVIKIHRMYYIYTYTNKVNSKIYVGKTGSIKDRKRKHKWAIKPYVINGKEGKKKKRLTIHNAIIKYGEDNFDFNVIDQADTKEKIFELERFYIKELRTKAPNGYNLTDGGEGASGFISKRKFTSKNDLEKYFRSHITIKDECWIWTGRIDKTGLPTIGYQDSKRGKQRECSVRRLSLELDKQVFPNFKAHIFSLCGDRICVNPKHLIMGDQARFWSKVDKSGECWVWLGGVDKDGCGKFNISHGNNGESTLKANRYAYEISNGTISSNVDIIRVCGNTKCVRPEHLVAKSNKAK